MPTAEALYNKGVVLEKADRRFEEAVRCFDEALEIDPNYVQAWYGKGDALYLMARCYDHARKIYPMCGQAWHGKGGALYVMARCDNVLACLEEALLCFDKVLELDPQNVAAAGRKQQTLKAIRQLE